MSSRIGEAIRREPERVAALVHDLAGGREGPRPFFPDSTLEELIDLLHEVALVRRPEALTPFLQRGASYGAVRRAAGRSEFPFFELHLLRQAFWIHLQDRLSAAAALDAILRIDDALALFTKACIRGHYRSSSEKPSAGPAALLHIDLRSGAESSAPRDRGISSPASVETAPSSRR